MLAQERHKIILDMLKDKKILKTADIIAKFDVSVETVRRDLEELESKNKLQRVYGGAIATTSKSTEPAYTSRTKTNYDYKAAIGKATAALINDGDTIILDIGTTTLEVAKNLKNKNITVITSSLPIINELANTSVKIYCVGGFLRQNELSMSGPIPLYALSQFYVDKAIIGAGGVTFADGVSDYNLEEAQIRKLAIERSNKTILVVDNSKFGVNALAFVCHLELIDTIVTDYDINKDLLNNIREQNIEIIIAEK